MIQPNLSLSQSDQSLLRISGGVVAMGAGAIVCLLIVAVICLIFATVIHLVITVSMLRLSVLVTAGGVRGGQVTVGCGGWFGGPN